MMKWSLMISVGLTVFCSGAAVPELVSVGDPGNPGIKLPFSTYKDAYLRGSVPYTYRMAVKEVSVQDYCDFLNRCADKYPELYQADMPIVRDNGRYLPRPGMADAPIAGVSRAASARFCNELSGDEVYRLEERGVGKDRHMEVIGFRDLTTSGKPVLYYLPDMHEFQKAAFYDGRGGYRKVNADNRSDKSHYGLENTASGVREWMENRASEASVAIGAPDLSTSSEEWNGASLRTWYGDHQRFPDTGFRVAATASVSVAPLLNSDNNFFGPGAREATLRIRSEAARPSNRIHYVLTDYFGKKILEQTWDGPLQAGANDLAVPLPEHDGYFQLEVQLADGSKTVIPLAVIRTPYSAPADGNFGICAHVFRWEKGFSREKFNFDRVKQLGAGILRTNVFSNRDSESVLPRIGEKGLRPLAILPSLSTYDQWRIVAPSEIRQKWEKHGVAPELAAYAEQVYGIVERNRNCVKDWEIGNEPQGYHVTPEDYAASAKAAAIAVRLAQPEANIMLGDMGSIAQPVLSIKTGEFVDSIAVHTYCNYNPQFWGTVGWMRRINGVKQANGIADKPVWMTEINLCTYNSTHILPLKKLEDVMHYQALYLPKAMAGILAYGGNGAKVLPYNFRNVPVESLEEEFGVLDRFGKPKPSFYSYRLTAQMLGDAGFRGFLKNHSTEIGKISALGFDGADNRQVAVLWRNDPYSAGDYTGPFEQLIGPRITCQIPGRGQAELFTLDGTVTTLTAKNGEFSVPVDEYPVFLRGDLQFETRPEDTALPLPATAHSDFLVQIIPDQENTASSMNLMGGYKLTGKPGEHKKITVRVHNLTGKLQSGTLRLVSPECWWDFNWQFTPASADLAIPANGIATATFESKIPASFRPGTELFLKAVFAPKDGAAVTDRLTILSVKPVLKAQEWTTYTEGWTLGKAGNPDDGIMLAWNGAHKPYGVAFYRNFPLFATDAKELNRRVSVDFGSEDGTVHAVSLLVLDRTGEVFQILKKVPRKPGFQTVEFDCNDYLMPGKFGHYNGNNDGKIDFPVRLQGFAFDLTPEAQKAGKGEILFRNYDRKE